jgi:hypothetical protein
MLYTGDKHTVNAKKWDGTAWGQIQIEYFLGTNDSNSFTDEGRKCLLIGKGDKELSVYSGDYIIKSRSGSTSVMDGKEFELKYKEL